MRIRWNHSECIVCSETNELSDEHLIPQSLGGILESRFLCKGCNESFGHGFESDSRLAPEIRKAASCHESLINLQKELEKGACYRTTFGEQIVERKLRKDGKLGVIQLEDGSLIAPEKDAAGHIRSMLRKQGAPDQDINNAIASWEAALANDVVDIGYDLSIRKWQKHRLSPIYSEGDLSRLVPLKIAYEFTALLIGSEIYRTEFCSLRKILRHQNEEAAKSMVTYQKANNSFAFHGIAFQGNHEIAQFQVRLFGSLAYTIRFPTIAIRLPKFVYTHQLNSRSESVHIPANAQPAF